jgi:hypothetical protein
MSSTNSRSGDPWGLKRRQNKCRRTRHDPCIYAPWQVDDTSTERFCIRDAKGQALSHVYYEDESGRRMAYGPTDQGRGAADRGEHRQAAGPAEAASVLDERRGPKSTSASTARKNKGSVTGTEPSYRLR